MDELRERAELDLLIEEQMKDDGENMILPEFPETVPLDEVDNRLGVMMDGEIVPLPSHERSSVMTGSASWHGTIYGYSNRKCKCARCKKAMAEWKAGRRATKKQEAAATTT